jgi:hypothetical protein
MTKAKKTKAPQRPTKLDKIVTQLRGILRRQTTDIIRAGNLLLESRKFLDHGEWQEWLAENFDLSYQTALNYMNAAKYAKRQKSNVGLLANLSATVLYRLAEGKYSEQEEAEILAQAKTGKRIDHNRAWAICEALAPPDDDNADDSDEEDTDEGGDDGAEPAAEDPEVAAILDGAPPVPPQAPELAPPDFDLQAFDQAIATLKRLMGKSCAQFIHTIHSIHDLENVESFVHGVTKARAATATANHKE